MLSNLSLNSSNSGVNTSDSSLGISNSGLHNLVIICLSFSRNSQGSSSSLQFTNLSIGSLNVGLQISRIDCQFDRIENLLNEINSHIDILQFHRYRAFTEIGRSLQVNGEQRTILIRERSGAHHASSFTTISNDSVSDGSSPSSGQRHVGLEAIDGGQQVLVHANSHAVSSISLHVESSLTESN